MDSEALKQNNSLGRDFLTYTCYQSDEKAGAFEIQGSGQKFSLWVDGKIVLADDRDQPPNTVTYSGDDFTNRELKQAIRSGKKVREARLRIEKGPNTWCFTLRADSFNVAGLKIEMPRTKDIDERFFDRMLNIEALNSILDALYGDFVRQLNEKIWQTKGYQKFQKWLRAE